jgi:hypothetical protein
VAILGPKTRSDLHTFAGSDVVREFRVFHDRVRVGYTDGLVETWDLDGERRRGHRLPRHGLWGHQPMLMPECNLNRHLDPTYDAEADPLFSLGSWGIEQAGWLDKRIMIHRLVARLVEEGWVQPRYPRNALEGDLRALRSAGPRYAPSAGYLRGQPGRPPSKKLPPGLLLCLDTTDWALLAAPGRPVIEQAWRDPARLRWSIEGLLRRGQRITRARIVYRLVCGKAEGFSSKAGPSWTPPSFWISVLRDILGYDRSPIVLDAGLDSGARAVAVGMMGGVYLHSPRQTFRTDGPLWQDGAVIEPDDESQAVDVVFADCASVAEFKDAIEQYGLRADRVVGALPWRDREAALELRGVSVVRYRPRPYLDDAVLAVWRPS